MGRKALYRVVGSLVIITMAVLVMVVTEVAIAAIAHAAYAGAAPEAGRSTPPAMRSFGAAFPAESGPRTDRGVKS